MTNMNAEKRKPGVKLTKTGDFCADCGILLKEFAV